MAREIVPTFDKNDYITFKVGPNLYLKVSDPLIDNNDNCTNLMNRVVLFGSGEIYEDSYDTRIVEYTNGYRPQVVEYINEGWQSPYVDQGLLGYAKKYSFCDIIVESGITHLGTLSTEQSANPLAGFNTGSEAEYAQYENYTKWNDRKIKDEYCCMFVSKDLEYIGPHVNIGSNFPGLVHIQFDNGSKLKEIRDIGEYYATSDRQLLETINIPPTCIIGGDGFMNCRRLYFINSTNSFGGFAEFSQGFAGCDSMTEFTLPDKESGEDATKFSVYSAHYDPDYDPDYYPKITTILRGDTSGVNEEDWLILGRRVILMPSSIIRLGHMGNVININGYNTGFMPFKHNGRTYWLKECDNGDVNQSPLVIKHNGTLHYIRK